VSEKLHVYIIFFLVLEKAFLEFNLKLTLFILCELPAVVCVANQVYVFNEAVVQEGVRPSLVGLFADVAAAQDNIVCIVISFSHFKLRPEYSSTMHLVLLNC